MNRYQKRVLRLRNHVLNHKTDETDTSEQPIREDKEVSNTMGYDDVTIADITKLLDDRGIDYNSRDTKQELYDLLLGSD